MELETEVLRTRSSQWVELRHVKGLVRKKYCKRGEKFEVICGFVFDFGCEAEEKYMMLDGNFILTFSFYICILNILILFLGFF